MLYSYVLKFRQSCAGSEPTAAVGLVLITSAGVEPLPQWRQWRLMIPSKMSVISMPLLPLHQQTLTRVSGFGKESLTKADGQLYCPPHLQLGPGQAIIMERRCQNAVVKTQQVTADRALKSLKRQREEMEREELDIHRRRQKLEKKFARVYSSGAQPDRSQPDRSQPNEAQ